MYVPATLAQPATALTPLVIDASDATPSLPAPARTSLSALREELNVLEGHATSVTGKLTARRRSSNREAMAGGATSATTASASATAKLHAAGVAGQEVQLQALGEHGWRTVAHTRTGANGRFRLRYVPREATSEQVRLRFGGDGEDLPAHRRLGALNVYRVAEASWYGGGGEMACGGELTSATMGVANKTLPCGTQVTLRYDGRTVRVDVIDRGPYVAGREFDLTEATKQALGFGGVGEVWSTR
ncbi:MAG TPA: RlpA-like double-psi beta-barrel domain-containing protein [Solirubrobacteraceae bacterium]